jgi:hypothetical protein
MKHLLTFVFIFYLAAQPIVRCSAQDRNLAVETKTPKTWCLLIGINDYSSDIEDLKYCINDTKGLADALRKAGIDDDHIIVMTDDAKDADLRPTKTNIIRQIELIAQIAGKDEQIVLSFSGHGAQIDKESFLCPSDTDLEKKDSFISRKWIQEQLDNSPASKKLFIVDACRNEFKVRGAKSIEGMRTLANPFEDKESKGIWTLASCYKGQQSWEDADFGHGIFTYYLMEGLNGAADKNNDGKITLTELYEYTTEKTKIYVLKKRKRAQSPALAGEYSGEFILVNLQNKKTNNSNNPITTSPERFKPVDTNNTIIATQTPTIEPISAYKPDTRPRWQKDAERKKLNQLREAANAIVKDGLTRLHIAARDNDVQEIKALLEAGADINSKIQRIADIRSNDNSMIVGGTPLHMAAENGNMDAVKTLVEYGASINISDVTGRTPLDRAKAEDVKEYLRSKGARKKVYPGNGYVPGTGTNSGGRVVAPHGPNRGG